MRQILLVLVVVAGCGRGEDAPAAREPAGGPTTAAGSAAPVETAAPAVPAAPAPAPAAAAAPAPDAAAAPAPAAAAPGITWAIEVSPARVSMAHRDKVRVTIRATNTTSAVRDPQRDPLDVLVDGKSSMELSMAFGNGGRERAWSAIPPGRTVEDARSGMELVDAPGDHVIAIVHDGHELARTVLHVTR